MGLALDELDTTNYVELNEIKVMLDAPVKKYVDYGHPITVDYRQSVHGSGFFIDTGSTC